MKRLIVPAIVACLFALAYPQVAPVSPPPGAEEAANCLLPGGYWLRFLQYPKRTRFLRYQYAPTGVPNSSMKGEPYSSVLFLSRSKQRALLFFAFRLPDGGLEVSMNGYQMYRTSKGWRATEGNGGPGMHERVELFVADLNKTPEYTLDMTLPEPKGCVSEVDEIVRQRDATK